MGHFDASAIHPFLLQSITGRFLLRSQGRLIAATKEITMSQRTTWRISCLGVVFAYVILFCQSGVFSFGSAYLVPTTTTKIRQSLNTSRIRWVSKRRFGISESPALSSTARAEDTPISTTDILICGGGPTGLLASIMLAQKFPKVRQASTKTFTTVMNLLFGSLFHTHPPLSFCGVYSLTFKSTIANPCPRIQRMIKSGVTPPNIT
jgi:hypothetical protein